MSPHSLDPGQPREYRRRASYIVAYGISAMVAGGAGLMNRELLGPASVGIALDGPVDEIWLVAYAVGGLLAAFGVLFLRPEFEAPGDYLLMSTALINAAAVYSIRGPVAGSVTSSGLLLAAWVLHRRVGDLHHAARRERRRTDYGPIQGLPERRGD